MRMKAEKLEAENVELRRQQEEYAKEKEEARKKEKRRVKGSRYIWHYMENRETYGNYQIEMERRKSKKGFAMYPWF